MKNKTMADKRTVKEILAVMETETIYIKNHLRNIDQHLDKLNDRTRGNERSIARIYGIGAGFTALAGIVCLTLWAFGVL